MPENEVFHHQSQIAVLDASRAYALAVADLNTKRDACDCCCADFEAQRENLHRGVEEAREAVRNAEEALFRASVANAPTPVPPE